MNLRELVHRGQGRRGSKELVDVDEAIDLKHKQVLEDRKKEKNRQQISDEEYAQELHRKELESQKKRQLKQKQKEREEQQQKALQYQKEMDEERERQQRIIEQQQKQRDERLNVDQSPEAIHKRMNTEQRIQLAVIESQTQAEFDKKSGKYMDRIEDLQGKLMEERERNEILTRELKQTIDRENILKEKNGKLIENLSKMQLDWDRMLSTFSTIVNQMKNEEKARARGEEVNITPAVKYERLLTQLLEMQSPKNVDLYANIATLFNDSGIPTGTQQSKRNKKMSFGAVNELFGDLGPGEITENLLIESSDSAAARGKVAHAAANYEDNQRLSFGGVGMLFANKVRNVDVEQLLEMSDDEDEPLPTYDGIADLFQLGSKIFGDNECLLKGKRDSYGGITEMFLQPLESKYDQQYMQKIEEEMIRPKMEKNRYTITVQTEDHLPPKVVHGAQYMDHDREQSHMSLTSDMSYNMNAKSKKHARGPSFTLQDMFNGDQNSDSDCPSMQSAPEEPHDYFAITAYYGIEDDDAGWDSRRSSWFGDYGQIKSRRESRRIKNQSQEIKALFDIGGMTNRMMGGGLSVDHSKLSSSPRKDLSERNKRFSSRYTDPIMEHEDIRRSRTSRRKRKTKLKKKSKLKTAAHANTVAELFDDDEEEEHRRGDTYTGVKAMFGSEPTYADGTSSDDDFAGLPTREIIGSEQAKKAPYGGIRKLPRPSTAVSLGATFDLIEHQLIDRHNMSHSMDADDDISDFEHERELDDDTEYMENMGANGELSLVTEKEIRKKLENEMQVKMENAAKMYEKLENEMEDKLRKELNNEIENKLRIKMYDEIRDKCINELRVQIERETNETSNIKIKEMNEGLINLETKVSYMKNQMSERELSQEIVILELEKSKCELVQATSVEINILRNSIREYSMNINKLLKILKERNQNYENSGYINKLWSWAI